MIDCDKDCPKMLDDGHTPYGTLPYKCLWCLRGQLEKAELNLSEANDLLEYKDDKIAVYRSDANGLTVINRLIQLDIAHDELKEKHSTLKQDCSVLEKSLDIAKATIDMLQYQIETDLSPKTMYCGLCGKPVNKEMLIVGMCEGCATIKKEKT